jgi:serine/threonine protein kinase
MSDPAPHVAFVAPKIEDLAPLFPGYEFEGLIATGGMGAVYRAVQRSLDRTVAIKVLPSEFSRDEMFCRNFEAEAKAMARLNHPNLIGVYDFGEAAGMLFIVMEYVPGRSLYEASHGKVVSPTEAARIVAAVCDGLTHAHENGILHRDIKPSNILLDQQSRPKIGDFGLARPVETKMQEGEEIFGTPHYTAPEVVQTPDQVGNRADIFSVGVMLHELLTGKLPASDTRPASVISRCDPRFDAIIRRATQPLPEMRQASAAEIARELRSIASSGGPRAGRGGTRPPMPARPQQPPRATGSAASSSSTTWVVIALLAAACGAAYVFLQPKPVVAPPAPTPAATVPSSSGATSQATPAKETPRAGSPDDSDTSGLPDLPRPSGGGSLQSPAPSRNDNVTSPKPAPSPSPAPTPPGFPAAGATGTPPKADVPAFLQRARGIMRERAAPAIAECDKQLAANLKAFDREFGREIRKLESRRLRDQAEEIFDRALERCRLDGNRIEDGLMANLNFLPNDMKAIAIEYQRNQEAIDDTLQTALKDLSATYVLGLEKQIERYKADRDPGAAELLVEEIDITRKSPDYFPGLILEQTP